MLLLKEVVKKYKILLEHTRQTKPLKIIEIVLLSAIPGETTFIIQVTNKNTILRLTAAEIINNKYNLNDFHDFHANMIRQAAQGKLIEYLKLDNKKTPYKIVSKKMDRKTQQYIFTIETNEKIRFLRTARELSNDKVLLENMDMNDIYDIGYTQGCESILKEKAALLLAKHNK